MNTPMMNKSSIMKVVVPAVIGLALVIAAFVLFGKFNDLRNISIDKEAALVAQYMDNQNELSNYVLQFKESLGVADQGSERLEEILVEAVQGRYDGNMEPGTGGSMFSAITEAYPDLTATSASYAKVQDLVVSGRDAFKNKQTKLLDMVRDYDSWRERDVIDSFIIANWVGAPSDRMVITVGSDSYSGQEALDKMQQIVLVQDSIDSYKTGTTAPLIGADPETEEP